MLAAILGSLWGAVAGYLGGALDAVMMRLVDAGDRHPHWSLLLLLVIISSTVGQPVLVVVVAATSWLGTARLVRARR